MDRIKLQGGLKRVKSVLYYPHFSTFVQLILILALFYTTYKLTTSFMLKDNKVGGAGVNKYCDHLINQNNDQNVVLLNNTNDECKLSYNFKKMIFMWSDGFAWDISKPVFDVLSPVSTTFRVRNSWAPMSFAIFTSYFTGKLPANIKGDPIKEDNLFLQLAKSGLKSRIFADAGHADVFNAVRNLDGLDGNIIFDKPKQYDDHAMLQWVFECQAGTREQCMSTFFNEQAARNESMFLSGYVVDTETHRVDNKYVPIVAQLVKQYANDLSLVKKWIDAHPDYLLVVASDHGGVKPGEHSLHGDVTNPLNSGWVMFYNPNIKPVIQEPVAEISILDVCATMSQFFSASGVNVPAESLGVVGDVTPPDDVRARYKALRLNAIQLMKFRGKNGEAQRGNFNQAEDLAETDINQAHDLMLSVCNALSTSTSDGPSIVPTITLFFILTVAAFVYLFKIQFGSWSKFIAAYKSVYAFSMIFVYLVLLGYAFFFAGWTEDGTKNNYVRFMMINLLGVIIAMQKVKVRSGGLVSPKTSDPQAIEMNESRNRTSSVSVVITDLSSYTQLNKEDEDMSLSESSDTLLSMPIETGRTKGVFCKIGAGFCWIFDFLTGNRPIPKFSPSEWLFMYAIVIFADSIYKFPLVDLIFRLSEKEKATAVQQLLLYIVLFLEFQWQRRSLISSLSLTTSLPSNSFARFFHPAFLVMNLKLVLYFVVAHFSLFDTNPSYPFAIYAITMSHMAILIFSSRFTQQELFLPVFILLHYICTPNERFGLYFLVIQLHFLSVSLSSALQKADKKESGKKKGKHLIPAIVLLMTVTVGWNYWVMDYKYTIEDVRAQVPGIADPNLYPDFSLFIMGFRKMGFYLLLAASITRLVSSQPNPRSTLVLFKRIRVWHYWTQSQKEWSTAFKASKSAWFYMVAFCLICDIYVTFHTHAMLEYNTFMYTLSLFITSCIFSLYMLGEMVSFHAPNLCKSGVMLVVNYLNNKK